MKHIYRLTAESDKGSVESNIYWKFMKTTENDIEELKTE
jgi:hypothetical protein